HTNGYDEALALPTEESARLALRTQQVLAAESGVAETADPLGGSYYVEALTDGIEQRALAYLAQVDELGGAARAIEWFRDEIHEAAYAHQRAVESGERQIVGVNVHRDDAAAAVVPAPEFATLEAQQRLRVEEFRARRDEATARTTLDAVRAAACGSDNVLPPMIEAVRAGATLGEISDVLRGEWGEYRRVAA
ncbi:MAG TPA: methylmalonyl-CoA mutase family protein, partial [Thermoanaerobaculia bacterium]|nr:methylmalonyl-CoA mutase family protein [Thermoanaerobaculia bacterium]